MGGFRDVPCVPTKISRQPPSSKASHTLHMWPIGHQSRILRSMIRIRLPYRCYLHHSLDYVYIHPMRPDGDAHQYL